MGRSKPWVRAELKVMECWRWARPQFWPCYTSWWLKVCPLSFQTCLSTPVQTVPICKLAIVRWKSVHAAAVVTHRALVLLSLWRKKSCKAQQPSETQQVQRLSHRMTHSECVINNLETEVWAPRAVREHVSIQETAQTEWPRGRNTSQCDCKRWSRPSSNIYFHVIWYKNSFWTVW